MPDNHNETQSYVTVGLNDKTTSFADIKRGITRYLAVSWESWLGVVWLMLVAFINYPRDWYMLANWSTAIFVGGIFSIPHTISLYRLDRLRRAAGVDRRTIWRQWFEDVAWLAAGVSVMVAIFYFRGNLKTALVTVLLALWAARLAQLSLRADSLRRS